MRVLVAERASEREYCSPAVSSFLSIECVTTEGAVGHLEPALRQPEAEEARSKAINPIRRLTPDSLFAVGVMRTIMMSTRRDQSMKADIVSLQISY